MPAWALSCPPGWSDFHLLACGHGVVQVTDLQSVTSLNTDTRSVPVSCCSAFCSTTDQIKGKTRPYSVVCCPSPSGLRSPVPWANCRAS